MKTTDRGLRQWTWLQGSCLQFAYGDKDLNLNSLLELISLLTIKSYASLTNRYTCVKPASRQRHIKRSLFTHTPCHSAIWQTMQLRQAIAVWTLPDRPSFMCCHNRRWWSPPSSQQKKFFWTGREVRSVFAAGIIYMAYSGLTGLHMSN